MNIKTENKIKAVETRILELGGALLSVSIVSNEGNLQKIKVEYVLQDLCDRCDSVQGQLRSRGQFQFCERCASAYDYWWKDKE